jgi:hypothetical protein
VVNVKHRDHFSIVTTGLDAARPAATALIAVVVLMFVCSWPAAAQNNWSADTQAAPGNAGVPSSPGSAPRAVSPPALPPDANKGQLTLEAYLTAEGNVANRRPIDRGLVWRVFSLGGGRQTAKLVKTSRDARPTLQLPAGQYAVNASFGRAYLTEMINVRNGRRERKSFVLNAGGLRVIAKVKGGRSIQEGSAHFDIFSDERDQSGARRRVVTNARPGRITRLNSGIYHIVSRLGDANAQVSAEVAVEAGKLTEAVVNHEAAKVTFKLVQRTAGEALADTQWIVMTKAGNIVKETAGALPTHVFAPGSYSVSARWGGKLFTRTFQITTGENVEIEVLMQ